jgi:hypothetical protein
VTTFLLIIVTGLILTLVVVGVKLWQTMNELALIRPSAKYYKEKQEALNDLRAEVDKLDKAHQARVAAAKERGVSSLDWAGLYTRIDKLDN